MTVGILKRLGDNVAIFGYHAHIQGPGVLFEPHPEI